jgi:hypothetical protein
MQQRSKASTREARLRLPEDVVMSDWWTRLALAMAVAATGCGGGATPGGTAPAAVALPSAGGGGAALERFLIEMRAPFAAGPMVRGQGWLRREYARGPVRIDVTVAAQSMAPGSWDEWSRQVRDYPQASLDVPRGEGSGFYSCDGDSAGAHCNLHIQLRSGFHVELMSVQATRADLDELARLLPLRGLAAAAIGR